MKKIITIAVGILFLLGLVLSSFPNILFGDLLSTHYGTTMHIMKDAIEGKDAWILRCPDKDCFLFIKAFHDNTIGLVGMNLDNIKDMMGISNGTANGNVTGTDTAQYLINHLKDKGWQKVPPTALPLAFRTLINSGIALNLVSKSITEFPVVPVAPFMNYPFETGDIQW